jgi:hypothetical protein
VTNAKTGKLLVILSDIFIRLRISYPCILGILLLDFICINQIKPFFMATTSDGPLLPLEKNTFQSLDLRHKPTKNSASRPNLLKE